MKKLILCLLSVISLEVFAQEVVPFALTKEGSVATYAILRGEKKKLNMGFCYYRFTTDNVVLQEDGSKVVTYKTELLNKKKVVSSMSGMVGAKDGVYSAIQVMSDGSYKMDQDLMYGVAGINFARGGYMFVLPAQMQVGDVLESSTVRQEYTMSMMGQNYACKTDFKYSDVKVTREEEITVGAGTFSCMVIEGTLSGTYSLNGAGSTLNDHFTLWVAPGVGTIRYRIPSAGVPVYIELSELTK